jgi:hypothetical protein
VSPLRHAYAEQFPFQILRQRSRTLTNKYNVACCASLHFYTFKGLSLTGLYFAFLAHSLCISAKKSYGLLSLSRHEFGLIFADFGGFLFGFE